MSETAWKWGAYSKGMGADDADPRQIYAVSAIKRELVYHGYDLDLTTTRFGPRTTNAVKHFQASTGLTVDGKVGSKTANALWKKRIDILEADNGIPNEWLRAQIHWESLDDPGAQLANPDGSVDRGLCQLNSVQKASISEEQAFDPAVSIEYLADFQRAQARNHQDCKVDKWKLAVGAWRTPVGADDWCDKPMLEPKRIVDGGTWGEQAVYYVDKVNTTGRLGWA